jgi:DNA invertase Pin-like site-specific DNA recombinase
MPARDPTQHLYGRISDPKQRQGGGLDRQTSADAGAFARRFGFRTAKRIYVDDGVSAWKGLNASPDHELGRFIADARRGTVRPGDCLLIENWDRLSRQNPWASISLVNDLRELGVHVGRLDRMKLLRCDSTDIGDFLETAVELIRAHSESEMKSFRNRDRWARKRQAAREHRRPMTSRTPAWLELTEGGFREIPERAAAVRRIFALTAAGYGLSGVVKRLTEEGVAPFVVERKHPPPEGAPPRKRAGTSGRWTRGYVGLLLSDRRTCGEFQPRGTGRRPDGDPISDYFPRVVSEEEWNAARAAAAGRKRRGGRYDPALPNPYSRLLKNALDGSTYFVAARTHRGKCRRVLINTAGSEATAPVVSYPFEAFDRSFRALLHEVNPAEVLGTAAEPDDVTALAARQASLEARLAKLETELEGGDPDLIASVAKAAGKVRGDLRDVTARLAEARHRAAHPLSETWGEAQVLLGAVDEATDRADAYVRLRAALRRIVDTIWMVAAARGRDRVALVQVQFKGGDAARYFLMFYRPPWGSRHGKRADVEERRAWSLTGAELGFPCDLQDRGLARQAERWLRSPEFAKLLASAD